MWTEILTEDIAVTHIGDMSVLSPLSRDVDERRVRAARTQLEERKVREQQLEEMRNLNESIKKEMEFMKLLQEAGYEPTY